MVITSFTVVYVFTLWSRRHIMSVQGRGEAGKLGRTESFPATLHDSSSWWMWLLFGTEDVFLWNHFFFNTTTKLTRGLLFASEPCLLPSHSFLVCRSPQLVTPASAELKVGVCSRKAWGWRRRQILRFTPKELALENLKSPSRDQVSYSANTSQRWFKTCTLYDVAIIFRLRSHDMSCSKLPPYHEKAHGDSLLIK